MVEQLQQGPLVALVALVTQTTILPLLVEPYLVQHQNQRSVVAIPVVGYLEAQTLAGVLGLPTTTRPPARSELP